MKKQVFYCDFCGKEFDVCQDYKFDNFIEFGQDIVFEKFIISFDFNEDQEHICKSCYHKKLVVACETVLAELKAEET